MTDAYEQHQTHTVTAIREAVTDRACQPILFVGSGLSKRYFGAPSWDELLEHLCGMCPAIEYEYGYYKQKYESLPEIGSVLAEQYREWAWTRFGREQFPEPLFEPGQPNDIYLKHAVAQHFIELTPPLSKVRKANLRAEITAIQQMQPHAIISTNYDDFLERIFSDFVPVIGQQILRANYVSVGEIFKIHGCATCPGTLVLTAEDYEDWGRKKKYLSAKLLTYFAEHPLVFLGYSGSDSNIRAILSDIDEILAEPSGLVSNLFFVAYNPNAQSAESLPTERLIELDNSRSIRVRNIEAVDLKWIFDAFSANAPIEKVNPKLLRALLARNYDLVRHDIPRKTVQINFDTLEHAVNTNGQFASLLGISTLDNPAVFNAVYPFTLTGVAKELGFTYWSHADKLIKQVKKNKGIDIKAFDNKYHITVKTGSCDTSVTQKYSQHCVDLLELVRDGREYKVDFTELRGPDQELTA